MPPTHVKLPARAQCGFRFLLIRQNLCMRMLIGGCLAVTALSAVAIVPLAGGCPGCPPGAGSAFSRLRTTGDKKGNEWHHSQRDNHRDRHCSCQHKHKGQHLPCEYGLNLNGFGRGGLPGLGILGLL